MNGMAIMLKSRRQSFANQVHKPARHMPTVMEYTALHACSASSICFGTAVRFWAITYCSNLASIMQMSRYVSWMMIIFLNEPTVETAGV